MVAFDGAWFEIEERDRRAKALLAEGLRKLQPEAGLAARQS